VYVGAGSQLIAVNALGRKRWQFEAGADVVSSPAYFGDDHVLAFGTEGGRVFVVDSTGNLDWSFGTGSPILSSPAPTRYSLLCIADQSGKVWAFGILNKAGAPGMGPLSGSGVLQPVPNPSRGAVRFVPSGDAATPGAETAGELRIFDVAGHTVAIVPRSPGGTFTWDGCDTRGGPAAPGVYLYRGPPGTRPGRLAIIR
jgi:outer membrane protein assembly factor BamB